MKQNEKVLVYTVTGFLLVILGIAILFGKDGPRGPAAPLPQQQPTAQQDKGHGLGELFGGLANAPVEPEHGTPDPSQTGLKPPDSTPLAATPPPTPAEEVHLKLGDSQRERDWRIVKARPGDSLTTLTQRWCGTAGMVEQVRSLNEGLQTLKVGQDVVVPWVDDAVLLAALAERPPAPVSSGSIPASNVPASNVVPPATSPDNTSTTAPAAAVPSRLYKMQSGDKLWNIAVKAVGTKAAPAFLEQVKQLNPQIADINSIRAGQELRLPAKG